MWDFVYGIIVGAGGVGTIPMVGYATNYCWQWF